MAFAIQFNGVDDTISALQKVSTELQAELDSLDSDLKGMLASWSGAAQDEYHICQTAWDNDAKRMQDLLTRASMTLGNVNENFKATEGRVKNSWTLGK
ncbi:WXG100 family type VII secretion target [Catenulispora pinisilvae]|uniref:WXG100 family type VII secretion target n=1 Tax=Catenulispora pinisilvae TaxID=2705253 RepID=UPI00189127A9|nr:WXG100 family type VII secretion target [Catenulispora pinisilvae]